MSKPKITGEQNPEVKEKTILSKKDIMFKVDEEGKVISEKVEVEVYDKVLDEEILLSTLELDNALTMFDATKKAIDATKKSQLVEIDKLKRRAKELENLNDLTKEQKNLLELTSKQLKEKEDSLNNLIFLNEVKLTAFKDKAKELRMDIDELEKARDDEKKICYIEAAPCTVAESHKYFIKQMYQKKGSVAWIESDKDDNVTYISCLLANKISNPQLTMEEWEKALPSMRASCKDAIADISHYQKRSPKEILVEKRRSEQLKNILGE